MEERWNLDLSSVKPIALHLQGLICCRYLKSLLRIGPSYGVTAVQPNGAQLQKVSDMVADGKVKVIIDRTYPLKDAQ